MNCITIQKKDEDFNYFKTTPVFVYSEVLENAYLLPRCNNVSVYPKYSTQLNTYVTTPLPTSSIQKPHTYTQISSDNNNIIKYKCPHCFVKKTNKRTVTSQHRPHPTRENGKFIDQNGLIKHIKNHHKDYYIEKHVKNQGFFCLFSFCGWQFSSLDSLLKHMVEFHCELFGLKVVDDSKYFIKDNEFTYEEYFHYVYLKDKYENETCILPDDLQNHVKN